MMHGAIYVVMKTEGELHDQVRAWVQNTMIFFIITYALTTVATLLWVPHMGQPFKEHPALGLVALVNMLAIANIPREIYHKRDFNALPVKLRGDGLSAGAAFDRIVPRHGQVEHRSTPQP